MVLTPEELALFDHGLSLGRDRLSAFESALVIAAVELRLGSRYRLGKGIELIGNVLLAVSASAGNGGIGSGEGGLGRALATSHGHESRKSDECKSLY